jgi:pimeloyl-ACP methyl ester carboxylesterase
MKEAIETRELIVLDGLDVVIRGTYHKTYGDCHRTQPKPIERGRIGVLFLNSPSPTRAAQGDSAVYWANSFAECGYPSFRLDLPGFGDSEGEPPTELLDSINHGGYAAIASVKIRELVTRFNLAGVVIVDQCASSISALYAAASCPECKGLVLVDPCFDLPQVIGSTIGRHPRDLVSQGCRRISSKSCDLQKQTRLFLCGVDSPGNADPPLLRRWAELLSAELPILIFKALSRKPKPGEFDYLDSIVGLAGRDSQVVIKVLDGADRSFASRLGRVTVRQRAEQWLNACFPLVKRNDQLSDTRFLT